MQKSLLEIFLNDLTLHCDKYLPYFPVYEQYFSRYRNTDLTFVEVGVQGGGSLQMWRQYFGNKARVIGVDIDPEILNRRAENVEIFIGDQGDMDFWNEVLPKVGTIDVFLDDGSHQMQHQIDTMIKVWPHIRLGGIYMVEDTHTSYYLDSGNGLLHGNTFMEYSKKLVDIVNLNHWQGMITQETDFIMRTFGDIGSVQFNNSMVTFSKGQPKWIRPNPYPNPLG